MDLPASSTEDGRDKLLHADADRILDILEAWPGPELSWTQLIDAVAAQTGKRYSSQTLQGNPRVQLAYAVKLADLRGPWQQAEADSELSVVRERVIRQERTIARLMLENMRLMKLLYHEPSEQPAHRSI